MCGRFTQTRPGRDVAEALGLDEAPALEPRYNIAPTQQVFAVRQEGAGPRQGVLLRWGLVPSWAHDLSIGSRLLNARADSLREKPAFRTAFARRRCLIAADGFYEWQTIAKKKQPIHFRFADGRVFAIAGLWERWTGPDGVVESCTVLTTEANDLVRPLHDRMPVILDPALFADWLNPDNTDTQTLQSWLTPYDPVAMAAVPASTLVNNPRNEGPACLAVA
jgi:putative SOS response-associated peptidase YedK